MNDKKIYKTQFLYGVDPNVFIDLKYKEAIEYKIKCAKQILHKVSNECDEAFKEGKSYETMQALYFRQKAIFDAITFNEKLLDELKT